MRTRTVVLLGVGLLVAAIAVGGAGMALALGHASQTPWGPGSMMGGNGPGSMMGQNGHGSMMGGQYGPGSMMGGQYGQPGSPSQTTPVTGVTQVQIVNFAYSPANIQVRAGTTVTWTNQDTAPHTVTFKNGMKDSGVLQKGQSFSYTFATPGTYQYYCAVHPNMIGTVIVV